jgi:two-component system sensor histidine kinase RegB
VPVPDAHHSINLAWTIRLRWAAIGVQLALLLLGQLISMELPLAPMLFVIGVEVASNLACNLAVARGAPPRESWLVGTMALDTVLLTALLSLSGGPFNPFSFLYLVQIALAAVVVREGWTWALAGLALLCSALLFAVHRELPVPDGVDHMQLHLRGMWLAFGTTAAFIVYFLIRVTRALGDRERELALARERAARQEKLASLATLAAGAAHELATPLSTIALAAKEQARRLERSGGGPALDDALLIRAQVDRCRQILDQLSADAGDLTGEAAVEVRLSELLDRAQAGLRSRPPVRVELEAPLAEGRFRLPVRAVARALRTLLKNGQEASQETSQEGSVAAAEVVLRAAVCEGALRLTVSDRGAGMAPEVLARAGEPFFTTKPPGSGMGLGLFLARSLVEQLGGRLSLESRSGEGTTVSISLPQ